MARAELTEEMAMRRINRGTGPAYWMGWKAIAAVLVAAMVGSPAGVPLTAAAQQQQDTARVTTLVEHVGRVLTNVVVRDKKTGELIKGLKPTDFQGLEENRPATIRTFDFQNVDEAVTLAESQTVAGVTTTKKK